MLATAISFFMGGERCAIELEFGSYPSHTVIGPAIINYALSIEISFKLLGLLCDTQTQITKTHNILELYEKMNSTIKEQLDNNCRKYFSFESLKDEIKRSLIEDPQDKEKMRSLFETWRYSFDYNPPPISIGFLQGLARSCLYVLKEDFSSLYQEYETRNRPFSPCESWSEFQTGRIEILQNPASRNDHGSDDAAWDEVMRMEPIP